MFTQVQSQAERKRFRDQLREKSFVILRLQGHEARTVKAYLRCGKVLFTSHRSRSCRGNLCLWHDISGPEGKHKTRWFTGLHRLKHRQTYRLRRLGRLCLHPKSLPTSVENHLKCMSKIKIHIKLNLRAKTLFFRRA